MLRSHLIRIDVRPISTLRFHLHAALGVVPFTVVSYRLCKGQLASHQHIYGQWCTETDFEGRSCLCCKGWPSLGRFSCHRRRFLLQWLLSGCEGSITSISYPTRHTSLASPSPVSASNSVQPAPFQNGCEGYNRSDLRRILRETTR